MTSERRSTKLFTGCGCGTPMMLPRPYLFGSKKLSIEAFKWGLVLSETWKRLKNGGYKVWFCFNWSKNHSLNFADVWWAEHENRKTMFFLSNLLISGFRKIFFFWLECHVIMKKCSSEMHQFQSTDPVYCLKHDGILSM